MSALPIVLDAVPDARALHRQFRDATAAGGDLRVEAGAVQKLSAACLQLFVSANAELGPKGHRLIVHNPSFSFGVAFEALGFEGDREVFTVEYV